MDINAQLRVEIDAITVQVRKWVQSTSGDLEARIIAELETQANDIDLDALIKEQVGRRLGNLVRGVVSEVVRQAVDEARGPLEEAMLPKAREALSDAFRKGR